MQGNQFEQIVCQLGPCGWHAPAKRPRGGLGVGQVVGLNALAERLAVAQNAADRDATKVDTVVALFAADQPGLGALALGTPVGAGHFERGVGRLRA